MFETYAAANDAQETVPSSFAAEETAAGSLQQMSPAGSGEAGSPASAPAATDPAASVETTRAFSERLKTMSGRRVDEFIAGMGLQDHTGAPIRTRAQYDAWQAARACAPQEQSGMAQGSAVPSDELAALRGELRSLRDAERDRALLTDPAQGQTYAALRDKVQEVQQVCRTCGDDVSLDAVYAAVLMDELPQLYRQAVETARGEALRTVQANGLASPGALGGGPAAQPLDFDTMSSADFAEYHRRALRGEWR